MSMGHFLEPTVNGDLLVFVTDDDLWRVSRSGGRAERLSHCRSKPGRPSISPDGRWVAFTGREEGTPEVYIIPVEGGEMKRLTWTGLPGAHCVAWTPDSQNVIFKTQAESPFRSRSILHKISIEGGAPENLGIGYGSSVAFGPGGGTIIGRFGRDPAQWKRYRGGRCGEIWIDVDDSGKFKKLLNIASNIAWPMWIRDHIWFIGDHDGMGNLYSCNLQGKKLQQHTRHDDFYARTPHTDGNRIVYQLAGRIHVLDIESGDSQPVDITVASPFRQRQRKMPDLSKNLESVDLHPEKSRSVMIARGKLFQVPNWDGAVQSFGITDGRHRFRLARWLKDGERIVALTDAHGDERICIFNSCDNNEPHLFEKLPLGRPTTLQIIPGIDSIVLTNHHHELLEVDLVTGVCKVIDRSEYQNIYSCDVSPDGRWIAYPCSIDPNRVALKLYDRQENEIHQITDPVLADSSPSFSPDGKYLYFLSTRVFDPVSDTLDFGYSFPRGVTPMALPLRNDLLNPFDPQPQSPCDPDTKPTPKAETNAKSDDTSTDKPAAHGEPEALNPVVIELDDIQRRAVAMPVIDGRFSGIIAGNDRIWIREKPIQGTDANRWPPEPYQGGKLDYWDLKTQTRENFCNGVYSFQLSRDRKVLYYRTADGLRILDASRKPPKDVGTIPGKKSGWVNLKRLKAVIEPTLEWQQMYAETWRLMRDHFYDEKMAGIDWNAIYHQYLPLIKRCSTRAELSDVIWECIGEVGTSHAYEMGGDYEPAPRTFLGMLGADLRYDSAEDAYYIERIVRGDSWDPRANSPLNQPGINAAPGHRIVAINGQSVNAKHPPGMRLLGLDGQKVSLTLTNGDVNWTVIVTPVRGEVPARLREWINKTTEYVHRQTDGRVGYLYMQDMGTTGFAQFHRAWLAESHRDAIIADVRQNAGGHVSSLLLERLSRKRLGFEIQRHSPPVPTPAYSVQGPIVALCDEFSGSDGDLFAHKFKAMKLGTLIGRRTWGGVVGIAPTHSLVDGTLVTQPEYYHYFDDVGWNLENHGAEPDIVVEMPPEIIARNEDPQLDRAIAEVMRQLETTTAPDSEIGPMPQRGIKA